MKDGQQKAAWGQAAPPYKRQRGEGAPSPKYFIVFSFSWFAGSWRSEAGFLPELDDRRPHRPVGLRFRLGELF
jgi:hypothetical protein